MKYGLPKTTIEMIRGIFARFPEIDKAVLYGSRAKGTYQAGSDIDLTLYGDALTPDLRDKIVDALDDLLLPYTIDLSLFDELDHAKLREHIKRVGVVFYERVSQGVGIGTGWQIKPLGDVCDVIAGQSPEGKYYNNEMKGLPFYQGKKEFGDKYVGEPTTWTTEITKEARQGDILMSVRAPVGPVNFATQRICIGRGLASIRASDDIDRDFLFNFLLKHEGEIVGNAGAVFNSISKTQIENIQIPLPPLPEQKRIVSILDEAFAGIATATANAKKNLANAREVFESTLQSVFSTREVDWVEKKLSDVSDITSALIDPRNDEYLEMLHVGAGNIESKTGRLIELRTAREEGLISGKFVFDETMVLYSKIRPYLMKIARPNFKGLCSADIYPLTVKSGQLDSNYLFYLLHSSEFTDYANAGSARAGMPKVNRQHLFTYRFYLPPITKQKEYSRKLDELSAETKRLEAIYQKKLITLDELKKSILNQAFSGQLH